MPFHPQVQAIRDQLEADQVPSLYTLPIEEARARDVKSAIVTAGTPEHVAGVRDFTIPGPAGDLAARLYRPVAPGPALPAMVYFLGGGWSLGTLDTSDAVCRRITNLAGCASVAVSYRLAPENKFPAAVDDCYAGTAWVASHAAELGIDATRLAVAGDSSGGNLAAAVALASRERGGPSLVHQLLVYPNTDYRADTDSMREVTDQYFFNPHAIAWYWGMYLATPADGDNLLASPMRAADVSGLPPATVITADFDPLRDESELYAKKLADAGVPTEVIRYDGMMHGFFTMIGVLDVAREAVATAADRLSRAFSA
ncbi:MAG TPA: alpha/beta hydrolase [Streptosporangiaceae bacterium]|nr:alpha/beta hydrolase [Streptosporangiaceae bacterium]